MNLKAIALFRQMIGKINDALGTEMVDPATRQKVGASDIPEVILEQIENFDRRSGSRATRKRRRRPGHRPRPVLAAHQGDRGGEGTQARPHEARRRAALGRAGDGQGLPRHEAPALRRRQDGRPPRQQGRHRPHRARGGHAVPRGRHAGRRPAQPAGRAQPHERRPDPRDSTSAGPRKVLGFQAVTPVFDGATEAEVLDTIDEANRHVEDKLATSRRPA